MLQVGTRVRVVNIDQVWDSERYTKDGDSYADEHIGGERKDIKNGDEGIIAFDNSFLGGAYIIFDNGDISQAFAEEIEEEKLSKAVEVIEEG